MSEFNLFRRKRKRISNDAQKQKRKPLDKKNYFKLLFILFVSLLFFVSIWKKIAKKTWKRQKIIPFLFPNVDQGVSLLGCNVNGG